MNLNDFIAHRIALIAHNGKYVAAEQDGNRLVANRDRADAWETFVIERHPSKPDGYALRSHWGYACAINGGGSTVEANRKEAKEWECFYIHPVGGDRWAFRTYNGHFLCADLHRDALLVADRRECQAWETFKIEMLHMQQQAQMQFIGQTVALQTTQGMFVAAEQDGRQLTANRQRVDAWERFVIERHPGIPHSIALRSHWGYVCAINGGGSTVEANRKEAKEWECFRLEPVGNDRWAIRTYNGHYLCADRSRDLLIVADRKTASDWEHFKICPAGTGVTIKPGAQQNDEIGKYRLVKHLGHGFFGDTWLAIDSVTGQRVAVKIYKEDDERFFKELRRSVEIFSKIGDLPHVVKYRECNRDRGRWFLAMDYCDGGTLRTKTKTCTPEDAKRYTLQLLKGLSALHERNIVHRDLKPENILLHGDEVQIGDLGIAIISTHTVMGARTGTWNYMAPEQLKDGQVSFQSDIWAVGVIFYELLHHRHPFPTQDAIRSCRTSPPVDDQYARFAKVLERAICPDRNGRFISCDEFKTQLKHC